ncbi:MAG TPA: TolC family protein [Pirellulales bacterium]|jgi:outer membrane protein TolC|nr:TolC family protein [Pirellulales bacterium]
MTGARATTLVLCAFVGLALEGPACAENLADAWLIALSANPLLQAQRINTSAAGLNLAAAERRRLPTGSANAIDAQLWTRTPGVNPAGLGQAVGQPGIGTFPLVFGANQNNIPLAFTGLSQPVYAGGRIRGNIDAAGAQAGRQRAEQFRTALDLKLNVAEAYVGVLQARRNLEVARSDVGRLQSFLNDVKNRQRVGMATRNEELSAEVSLANARLREIQTRNAQTIAWSTYNRYLMRPLDFTTQLQEVGPPDPPVVAPAGREPAATDAAVSDPAELIRLTDQALRSRPELASLTQQARALGAQAEVTRAGVRPNVNVAVNYVYLGLNGLSNNNIVAASAVGSWSFYDGGATRRQAQAQEQQGRALLRQRADQAAAIALEVRTRWINLSEARERITVSRVAVRQSEENVNVVQDRYRQQLSTYTEVLDAEAQRVQAYANFYNATYDAAQAWFRLRRAVGDL